MILRALWVSSADTEVAVHLLERLRGQVPWESLSFEEKKHLVEDVLLDASAEEQGLLCAESRYSNVGPLCELTILFGEFLTAKWVLEVNETYGVAPSTLAVYRHYVTTLRGRAGTLLPLLTFERTRNAQCGRLAG